MTQAEYVALLASLLEMLAPTTGAPQARQEVAALAPGSPAPAVLSAATLLGRALMQGGQFHPAERLFAPAVALFPDHPLGFVGLAHIASQRGQAADALARWDAAIARFPDKVQQDWLAARGRAASRVGPAAPIPGVAAPPPAAPAGLRGFAPKTLPAARVAFANLAQRMDGLARTDRMPEARALFPEAVAAAQEPAQFRTLLMMIAPAFENFARAEAMAAFRDAFETRAAGFVGDELRVAEAVRLRLCLLMRDYAQFVAVWSRFVASRATLSPDDAPLARIAAKVSARNFPDFTAEKVFCIGLSKTGTTSITTALEMLGFSAMHWTNPVTQELMSGDDLLLFDAFADLPVCECFERNYHLFPNARFIYTTRPFASWKRSYETQMRSAGQDGFLKRRARMMTSADDIAWGAANARLALSIYYNHDSIEAAFHAYDARVRRFFADKPAGRFLEFDIASGHAWPELCGFTGRPIPDAPYPQRNVQASAG